MGKYDNLPYPVMPYCSFVLTLRGLVGQSCYTTEIHKGNTEFHKVINSRCDELNFKE